MRKFDNENVTIFRRTTKRDQVLAVNAVRCERASHSIAAVVALATAPRCSTIFRCKRNTYKNTVCAAASVNIPGARSARIKCESVRRAAIERCERESATEPMACAARFAHARCALESKERRRRARSNSSLFCFEFSNACSARQMPLMQPRRDSRRFKV